MTDRSADIGFWLTQNYLSLICLNASMHIEFYKLYYLHIYRHVLHVLFITTICRYILPYLITLVTSYRLYEKHI